MRILYLLPSLEYNGSAKQALLLARGLAGSCDLRVCGLHQGGPWARALREKGITVSSLGWIGPVDLGALWRLRRLLSDFRPDCIHVWRLPALRALALAGQKYLACSIVSQVLPTTRRQPWLGRLDRWLLRRAFKLIAGGAAEARQLGDFGFGPQRVLVIPPGVEIPPVAGQRGNSDTNDSRTAENAQQRIVCLGNLGPTKGFREALLAADFLTYPFADLELTILGNGPLLASLKRFKQGIYFPDHMQLLGAREDAGTWLAQADVCWVPSLTATGRQVALEAMAAGRPVIASDLPHFREIIVEGTSGLLVPPGNVLALARRTREVFLDADRRRSLGEAARKRARAQFGLDDFVANFRALYGTGQARPFRQNAAYEPRKHGSVHAARAV